MSYDSKIDREWIDPLLSKIAAAIRNKTNTYGGMNYDEMADKIRTIQIGYRAPQLFECTSVDTVNKTWTGVGWRRDSGCLQKYSYETTGLTYTDTPPVVGTTYTSDGDMAASEIYECAGYDDDYVDPYDADVMMITGGYADDAGNATEAFFSIEVTGHPNISGLEYTTDVNSDWRPWKPEYKYKFKNYTILYIRNTESTLNTSSSDYITFKFEGDVSISGKASGLLGGSTECAPYCFYKLFAGCHMSLSTSFLSSMTTTADHCYAHMFDGATGFSGGESGTINLPALDVATYAYSYMFANSDVQRVSMPHQQGTLHQYACSHMFDSSNRTSCVITAPVIEDYACEYICYNCKNLNYGGVYNSITSIGTYAFQYAFANSTSSSGSSYPTSATVSLSPYAFYYAYANSSEGAARINVTSAPTGCFEGTWSGCSKLTDVYCYLLDYGNATTNWLAGVAETGKFRRYGNGEYDPETYVEKMLPVKWGDSYIPDGWTVEPASQMLSDPYITVYHDGVINYELDQEFETEDKSAHFEYTKTYEEDYPDVVVRESGHVQGYYNSDVIMTVTAKDSIRPYSYYLYLSFLFRVQSISIERPSNNNEVFLNTAVLTVQPLVEDSIMVLQPYYGTYSDTIERLPSENIVAGTNQLTGTLRIPEERETFLLSAYDQYRNSCVIKLTIRVVDPDASYPTT